MNIKGKSPDPIDIIVGKQLRRIRRLNDMSLNEVGGAVGLSYQQVQKYERGANRISASKLVQFARLFNVSIELFFEHVDKPEEGITALDDSAIKAAALFAKMPKEYHKPLRIFMKSIVNITDKDNEE